MQLFDIQQSHDTAQCIACVGNESAVSHPLPASQSRCQHAERGQYGHLDMTKLYRPGRTRLPKTVGNFRPVRGSGSCAHTIGETVWQHEANFSGFA